MLKKQGRIKFFKQTSEMSKMYSWATHFIGAGGSNTVLEVLSMNLPCLIIARDFIEDEQELLLTRWMKIAGLDWIREKDASGEVIFNKLKSFLNKKPLTLPSWVSFTGATKCAQLLIKESEKFC